jgi:hypothetical protein
MEFPRQAAGAEILNGIYNVKKSLFLSIWFVFLLLIWEGSCYLSLWWLEHFRHLTYSPMQEGRLSRPSRESIGKLLDGLTSYTIYDPDLGWAIKSNGTAGQYRANADGLRGDREYSASLDPRTIRIATYGDSFAHGDEVSNEHTWQVQLEQYDSRFEVLNFGVGGYGPDQSYLRYRKLGKSYKPVLILIGFTSENIFRTMSVFRPFYAPQTRLPLSKPRFTLSQDSLVLLNNPLPSLTEYRDLLNDSERKLRQLGAHDWFYQHRYRASLLDVLPSIRLIKILSYKFQEDHQFLYHPESEAFKLSLAILTKFYQDALADSSTPIILLFPVKGDVQRAGRGVPVSYSPLRDALDKRSLKVIDLAKSFQCWRLKQHTEQNIETLFETEGHYSEAGNHLIAGYLHSVLINYFNGTWRDECN